MPHLKLKYKYFHIIDPSSEISNQGNALEKNPHNLFKIGIFIEHS